MNIKTLLLGTAAAMTVVGSAQAADLAVAEPVGYVKVCDAYGTGFFYVPGSDTCVKIGAYVQLDTMWQDGSGVRDWNMTTEAGINVTGKWQSELGEGTVFLAILGKRTVSQTDPSLGDVSVDVNVDKAYVALGGFVFGYTDTVALAIKSLNTDDSGVGDDHKANQISWHGDLGPIGIALGIEQAPQLGVLWDQLPSFVAALNGTMGGVTWKLAGEIVDTTIGTGYGVGFSAKASVGSLGVQGNVSWARDDAPFVGGPTGGTGDWFSAMGSISAPLGGSASIGAYVSWLDGPAANDETIGAAVRGVWNFARNAQTWVEVGAKDVGGAGFNNPFVKWRVKAMLPNT